MTHALTSRDIARIGDILQSVDNLNDFDMVISALLGAGLCLSKISITDLDGIIDEAIHAREINQRREYA